MKSIFKYFTLDTPESPIYVSWFIKNFPYSEFKGIDLVLYFFLEYCSILGIQAKRDYLFVFIKTELRKVVRKHNIHIDSLTTNLNYEEIAAFEQALQVISDATVSVFDAYMENEVTEFKVSMAEFMSDNLKDRITNIFMEQFANMNTGNDILNIADETQVSVSQVRKLYDVYKLQELDFLLGVENKNTSGGTKTAKLLSKTCIPAIDEDYGGVFSKALITFAGQPGSGKTRFLLAAYIYPALVMYKQGVRLDELELADYEIENILISIHIAKLYKVKIPDRDINRDELSEEQRKIVESARIDLFESGKYGRFVLSTENLVVEQMYEDAITFFKFNKDISIWCIDYIGRIVSKPTSRYEHLSLAERIDASLRYAKDVAKKVDICAVCVNQYNDEGNKAAFNGAPITVGMIQGGQAVQRHSDYDIAITYTHDQKAAGLRMISTTKDRASVGFQYVPLQTDLAISRFTQIQQISERG